MFAGREEQSFSSCAAAHLCPLALAAGRLSWVLEPEISRVAKAMCLMDDGIWVASFLLLSLLLACPVALSSGFCPQSGPSLCGASVSPAQATLLLFVSCSWMSDNSGCKSSLVTMRKLSSFLVATPNHSEVFSSVAL